MCVSASVSPNGSLSTLLYASYLDANALTRTLKSPNSTLTHYNYPNVYMVLRLLYHTTV